MGLFPFPSVRKYQDSFMKDFEAVLHDGGTMFAEVPTGVGKTAAALSVSLERALNDGYRVIFLTPRHSQHMIVLETVRMMNERGADIRAADLVGKKWMCNIDGIEFLNNSEFNDYCRIMRNEEKCQFYNKTYESGKLSKASIETISHIGPSVSSDDIKKMCESVCPYEISMHLARKADVVVADYFHVFSPARESFLSRINGKLENMIIIADEAHNLPDRIRSNISKKMTSNSIDRAVKEAKLFGHNDIVPVLRHMKKLFRKKGERRIGKQEFLDYLRKAGEPQDIGELLVKTGDEIKKERKKSYVSSIGNFILSWIDAGDEFAFIYRNSGKAELSLSCLDPSVISRPVIRGAYGSLFMSGTLKPLEMYASLLGAEDAVLKSYPSPFPKSNRMDIILTSVTSRFSKRSEDNMRRIAMTINHLMNDISWSMAFFFPSYGFMRKIHSLIPANTRIIMEQQGMGKGDRERFYRKFIGGNHVLFGVSSGSFSEGVDYPGNKIKLVGIVGLPLGTPDLETQSLIDYYEMKFGSGWNYAYSYPAIIKTLQAAGRSIRSETDKGVIVYMDERFAWRNYIRLLPDGVQVVDRLPYDMIVNFLK